MPNESYDESLGVEQLPQAELEATPGFADSQGPSPLDQLQSDEELSSELEPNLTTLLNQHGLTAILEALKALIEVKAQRISTQPGEPEVKAFEHIIQTLSELIDNVPPEVDIEITLDHLTHSSSELESGTPE